MSKEDIEDKQYVRASSRWLFEMNFLNNDYIKSAMMANIYVQSRFITNSEILVDQHNKRMLILIELSFIGNIVKNKEELGRTVEEIIKDALPSYDLRVIYDKDLFQKSVKMLNPTPEVSEETPKEAPIEEAQEDSKEKEG